MTEFEMLRLACELLLAIGAVVLVGRDDAPAADAIAPPDEDDDEVDVRTLPPAPPPRPAAMAAPPPVEMGLPYADRQLVMLGHALRYGNAAQVERFAKRVMDLGIDPPTTPQGCDEARAALRD